MNYKDYINLGFKRVEQNDNVEFNETGYTWFFLTIDLNKKASIEVCNGQLNEPRLYLNKGKSEDNFHIITLTTEQVIEILKREPIIPQYA